MADTHHSYPPKSSSASLKGCIYCFLILLSLLLLLLLSTILVVAFIVKPKKPQFDLQQVYVSYLLVSPDSPSASLSLNITMLFRAKNPNKISIRYGASGFSVLHRGVPLGLAELPAFEQPAYSTRFVETRFAMDRVNVFRSDAVDLVQDATVNDRVELRIAGDVAARIRFLGITSPRVQV